jgi:sRNA-binding protein
MKEKKENPACPGSASGADWQNEAQQKNPTTNSDPRKARKSRTVAAVLQLLAERWPAAFSILERKRRPLAIGIHHAILAALDGVVTPAELSTALGCYVGNPRYLKRLRKGAVRFGLDGAAVGAVTPEQALHAQFALQEAVGRDMQGLVQ